MADKITFDDKSHILPYGEREVQVWDLDINEIKAVVNNNADILETIEANQFTSFVAVKTFADLPTPGVLGTGYYVLDDPTPSNNGMWGYDTAYYQANQTVNSGDFNPTDNVTPATQKSTSDFFQPQINDINDNIKQTELHPPDRYLDTFTVPVGAGWWTETDNWFDGENRSFQNLYIDSLISSFVRVGFFTIDGSNSVKISDKSISLIAGVNELSLTDIIDDTSLIIKGTKYYIFIANQGDCMGYDDAPINNGYYINLATETTVGFTPYKFSFWLKTDTYFIFTEEDKTLLYKLPEDSFDFAYEVANNDYVFVPPGTHIVTTQISLREGQTIEGIRGQSIIKFDTTSLTLCMQVYSVNNVTVTGIVIEGDDPDVPLNGNDVASGVIDSFSDAVGKVGIGTHTGLFIYGTVGCNFRDIEVRNFDSYGIWARNGSADYFDACNFDNIYTNNCYIGMAIDSGLEYMGLTQIRCNRNQIGLVVDAGNNVFATSHIDGNRVGLMLLNGNNSAHGSFGVSTFNHNSLYGIISEDVTLSESFTGCQIWHGDIYIQNSRGISFVGCTFANLDIYADGNHVSGGMWMVSDSLFRFGTVTINEDYLGNLSNLILKNNWYMEGQDSTDLNN